MAPSLSRGIPVVYILRLRSGTIYIGCTNNLPQRLADHAVGLGGRTTAVDPPAAILRVEVCETFSLARTREAQLKRWSRAKKEALIGGDASVLRDLSRSHDHR